MTASVPTPPMALIEQWSEGSRQWDRESWNYERDLARQAARWGYQQAEPPQTLLMRVSYLERRLKKVEKQLQQHNLS